MHGLQTLIKQNNRKLHDTSRFAIGAKVQVQSLDGKTIHDTGEVTENDPKLNVLTAVGIIFDKSTGFSRDVHTPVELVSLQPVHLGVDLGKEDSHSTAALYRRGRHMNGSLLGADMGHGCGSRLVA